MKKVVLYCDRHDGEHPAVTTVWLKTVGMSRIVRVDVCEDAFRTIMGNMNGAPKLLPAPDKATGTPRGISRGGHIGLGAIAGSDTSKLVNAVTAFLKNHHQRFTLDHLMQILESLKLKTEGRSQNLGRVMRTLVADGTVQRHGFYGVFSRKDLPPPPKLTSAAETATAIAKCIRAQPGLRVAYLPGLLELEPPVIKRTLKQLVALGLVRTKGGRSASRAWPVEKKNG
jgi:hypothetical protein